MYDYNETMSRIAKVKKDGRLKVNYDTKCLPFFIFKERLT